MAVKMSKLFHYIKLPRSGGSTLGRKFLNFELDIEEFESNGVTEGRLVNRPHDFRRLKPNEPLRVLVNEDSIMLALTGKRFTHKANPMVKAIAKCMIRAYLNEGYTVLCDETYTTLESIEDLLWIADATPIWIFKPQFQQEKYFSQSFGENYVHNEHVLQNEQEWNDHQEMCIQRAIESGQEDLVPIIKWRLAAQLFDLSRHWNEYKELRNRINKERQ